MAYAGTTLPLRMASRYGPKALFRNTISIYSPHPQRMGTWGKASAYHISVFFSTTERGVYFYFHACSVVIADFRHISFHCFGFRHWSGECARRLSIV